MQSTSLPDTTHEEARVRPLPNPQPRGRRSRAYGLMYHGILVSGGVASEGTRSYNVSLEAFVKQVMAMKAVSSTAPTVDMQREADETLWAITFDDGAESSLLAAEVLESVGWRGQFFVVTSWIGNRGFLTRVQIGELRARGHVIGSHSVSHPDPMSSLPYSRLLPEWKKSAETLSDILGEAVTTAAVPGGAYSRNVARAAAEVGITLLFTSEPVSRTRDVAGCTVIGRCVVRNSTRTEGAVALATGDRVAWSRQWLEWNSLKLAKKTLGSSYYRIRAKLLALPRKG